MTQDSVSEEMEDGKLRLFMPDGPSFLRKGGPLRGGGWG